MVRPSRIWSRRRRPFALLLSAATLFTLPRFYCGQRADRFFDKELATQVELGDSVAAALAQRTSNVYYASSALRFNGQSAVALDQMAVMGLAQIVLEHPELKERYLPAMRRAAHHLAAPSTLVHASRVYGHHGAQHMGAGEGHAYLGYINLGLGMLRAVDPDNDLVALHERLSHELAERLFQSPTGLIETYPGETWPPDVSAVAGSIGLYARLTGADFHANLARWAERFSACSIGAGGYLVQRVKSGSCTPLDAPRGSGTAVAAYFLSFVDRGLSSRLHAAVRDTGARSLCGFGAIREYAPGFSGSGDNNAGPMLLGVSVGATGFALGAAAAHADRSLFRELYRTLDLFGAPVERDGLLRFELGGALGNALLLAMLTARAA